MNFDFIPWRSFKTRMTLFTLAIFLMGVWSLEFYTSTMLRKDMQQMLSGQQFATVSLLAAQVNEELENRLKSLKSVSVQISSATLTNPAALQTLLEQRPVLEGLFNNGIFVTGIDGTAIASVSNPGELIGINFMERDCISTALKEGKAAICKPVKGKTTRTPIVILATPISERDGKVIGVLAGMIDLSKPTFMDRITDNPYGKTGGYFLVASRYRLIVTASDKTRVMQQFPAPGVVPAIDRFLQGYEESAVYVNPLGIEVLGSIKNIPVAGWFLGAVLPTEEAFAPVRAMQYRMFAMASLLTLLAGGLTWWMTLKMLRQHLSPMLTATEMLVSMSDTNQIPQALPITSTDEIGDLIRSFNRLLENLAQREESLRESEDKFQTVADYIYDWEYWRAADGSFVYISPSCERITGYKPEEFRQDPGLLTRIIHPDDRENFVQHVDDVVKGVVNKDIHVRNFRILTRSGEECYIEHICREVFNREGKSMGSRVTNRDITEREKAAAELMATKEELERFFDLIPDLVCIASTDGYFKKLNIAWETSIGFSIPELLSQPFENFIHPEDIEPTKQEIARQIGGNKTIHFINRYRTKKGSDAWLEWNAIPAVDGSNLYAAARDITERKLAEAEKERMQAKLQQAQKMEAIGTLAGGIAHDFNNILGAILGYAEMAYEDSLSGSVKPSDLTQVIEASHRAKDLVKQILAFSRQAGAQKIPLRPAALVKESIKLLHSSIPTTIEIRQDIDPETDPIQADPTQIHQIIMNLCTNAYHAMEETGGILSICLKNKVLASQDLVGVLDVQPGRFVQLSIKDTGSGIAPEIQERIFDPYFTTKEVGKGTGMGLAIVHGIVKNYGGFITCHSEIGAGTVFEICLPAFLEEIVSDTKEVELIPVGTERILFIDDEGILTKMSQTMLERLGYRVTVQMNSLQALATFKAQPQSFDLVITDQTMPELTGFDLARRILQIRPGMPIILCTGYSNQISEEKVKSSGIKGFAMKPLARKSIAVLIRKILD